MDTTLIKNISKKHYQRAEEKDFGSTSIYKVIGDTNTLYYWNSSNSSKPQHDSVLDEIMELILDNDGETIVNDGWNEIMFNVE